MTVTDRPAPIPAPAVAPDSGVTADSALAALELTVGYERRMVIDGLSVDIPAGSFTAIIGPNACGKSTLLRTLARLLAPTSGHVLLSGRDIATRGSKELARELGLLPQTALAPDGIRVADLIARGRYPHQGMFDRWSPADERAVRSAMTATGVTELSGRLVDELSGGQRQRVWVAMVLAQETSVLLLDEPTTFLDIAHQVEMMELLRTINRVDGRTLVVVLHDLNQAARYASQMLAMRDGRIVAAGSPEKVITPDLVEDVFALPCRVVTDPESGTPLVIPRLPDRDDGHGGPDQPGREPRLPEADTRTTQAGHEQSAQHA